jgi:hypothetical protein
MKKIILPLLVLSLTLGCAYTASFNRSPYVTDAARQYTAAKKTKSAEEILFLKEYPKESHVVIGTLHAPEIEWTARYDTDDLIKAMRNKAVEIGADAIVNFRYRENPTMKTLGVVSVSGTSVYGSFVPVPYKGLHAWGEAIVFMPDGKPTNSNIDTYPQKTVNKEQASPTSLKVKVDMPQ